MMDELLRLNPRHPFAPLSRRNSYPSLREILELRDALARERQQSGSPHPAPQIERHHGLPRQHWQRFPSDVDPKSDEYIAAILAELHRSKTGLHGGKDNWNKKWENYLVKHLKDELDKRKIDAHLSRMVEEALRQFARERPEEE